MTQPRESSDATLASDPIFLEVFWTRVRSAANEAAKLIVRTSFSTLSSEANDFAVVVTDANGRAIAENSGSIPSFIGTLPATVRETIRVFGTGTMKPGDVFITNNPWIGTGHLNDVSLVKPIFYQDHLVGFAAAAAHMPDIGGKIRSVDARELFEEGFHIPLMRFLTGGRPDETLLALVRTNVRTPEQTTGDIWTQVAAVELIASRLTGILAEYGLSGVTELAEALFQRSREAMAAAIRALPDGEYHHEMATDGFDSPFRYVVTVRVRGDTLECDFTGTSPQQPRGINCVLAYTRAMSCYAIKCLLLPDLPNNHGLFEPIQVTAERGSILNPVSPAAVGGRSCTGHYVPVAIFAAMHAVLPSRVMAGVGSPLWIANLNGVRKGGKPFATVLFYNGGMGATAVKDGESVMSWPSNISATPVEIAEREAPLFFRCKRLREGSGGVGTFRGGLGEEIAFTSTHDAPLSIVFLTERLKVPAPGLGGGQPGSLGEVRINSQPVDSRVPHVLQPGDEVTLGTPGGGGFGAPGLRDAARIAYDAAQGYAVSPAD